MGLGYDAGSADVLAQGRPRGRAAVLAQGSPRGRAGLKCCLTFRLVTAADGCVAVAGVWFRCHVSVLPANIRPFPLGTDLSASPQAGLGGHAAWSTHRTHIVPSLQLHPHPAPTQCTLTD